MKKTFNYEWVCHACAHTNEAGQPHCRECGCSASAGIEEIEAHLQGDRKLENEQDHADRKQVSLWVCVVLLFILYEFFLRFWW